MKITSVSVERTFNLGNYESDKIRFEAQLSEGERPLEVTADLEMLCHQHMENIRARQGTAATQPTPQKTAATHPQTAAEMANESQRRREQTQKADPTVCPKCGRNKKPQYDLCYTCHEEEKAT